jgi:hypothetical protein
MKYRLITLKEKWIEVSTNDYYGAPCSPADKNLEKRVLGCQFLRLNVFVTLFYSTETTSNHYMEGDNQNVGIFNR